MKDLITNQLAEAIYKYNFKAGWWDEPVRPDGTTLALIHSEVTEAYIGFVHDIPDHHLPQYQNVVVELADAAIRIYDLFGHKGWNIEKAVDAVLRLGADDRPTPEYTHVNFHKYFLDIHVHISNALEGVRKNQVMQIGEATEDVLDIAAFELAIAMLMIYHAECWGWDIPNAIGDKRAYNANRADHKRENRAKDDGKKF